MTLSILHEIPGRLRVRLPGERGPAVATAVGGETGVTESRWSPRTRSLLVGYRPDMVTGAEIVALVAREAGLAAPAPVGPPASVPAPGVPPMAKAVAQGVAELNAGVRRLSGDTVDLRTLVPLALTAWAVREIARGQAGPLAWSTALWYAHGLFRDYGIPEGGA